MRILLVGEYSNFHNSLKHGLVQLGHEVVIVGDGDGFKDLPVDIYVGSDYYRRNWWREKFKVFWFRLTNLNLEDNLRLARFRESEHLLKNFDIVQFVNSNPFNCEPAVELKMLSYLVKNNGNCFLAACGDDYHYTDYLVNRHVGYSILDAVKRDESKKQFLAHTYKYLEEGYKSNYDWLVSKCKAIVPMNVDYAMSLQDEPKSTVLIPAPVVTSKFGLKQNENIERIHIFLGINRSNYWKKGINYFEEALELLRKKYPDKFKVTIAENLPYTQYIQELRNAHILLDQVLAYDQGYNALEGMLCGKVVFAGAGEQFLNARKLDSVPVIDAQPNTKKIFQQLETLIKDPDKINTMGKSAREYVIEFHDSVTIAEKYVEVYVN